LNAFRKLIFLFLILSKKKTPSIFSNSTTPAKASTQHAASSAKTGSTSQLKTHAKSTPAKASSKDNTHHASQHTTHSGYHSSTQKAETIDQNVKASTSKQSGQSSAYSKSTSRSDSECSANETDQLNSNSSDESFSTKKKATQSKSKFSKPKADCNSDFEISKSQLELEVMKKKHNEMLLQMDSLEFKVEELEKVNAHLVELNTAKSTTLSKRFLI